MTLEEAGKIYLTQKSKMEDVQETIRILHYTIDSAKENGNQFTTCIVSTDILRTVTAQLEEHLKHLKYVMDKEIHVNIGGSII